MDIKLDLESLLYKTVAQHMINMSMRVHQHRYLQPIVFDKIFQLILFIFLITTRINDHGLARFIVQHISVFLNRRIEQQELLESCSMG